MNHLLNVFGALTTGIALAIVYMLTAPIIHSVWALIS